MLPVFLLQAPIPVAAAQDLSPQLDGLAQDEEAEEAEEAEPEPVKATTYALNPGAGLIYVRTYKEGVAAALAHDHAIHATGWSGTVTWHPEDASQCKIDITVPVSGLVVDDTSVRNSVGIAGEVDAGQREDITEAMLGADQLNAAGFSTISFSATRCSGTSGQVNVTGNMTIRGKSTQLTVPMNVSADGSSFSAQGSFSTGHAALGLTAYSAMFGAIANGDRLDFGVNVQGTAK